MVYLALAFKIIKLRLLTMAKTQELPEGEAWVKKFLQEKYRPNDFLATFELRKRLDSITMKHNQDPSDLFEEFSALEHAYYGAIAKLEGKLSYWCSAPA